MSRTSPAVLSVSPAGVALITQFEGFVPYPYWDLRPKRGGGYEEWTGGVDRDPNGKGTVTIGYGHTNLSGVEPRIKPGMRMTEPEARRVLLNVLNAVYAPAVRRQVAVPLEQHEFDALVSFTYNCGEGALKRSTLLKVLNRRDYASVPKELMKWTRSGGRELRGLVRRRRAEAEMWRGLAGASHDGVVAPEPMPRGPDVDGAPAPSPVKDGEGLTSIIGVVSTLAGALTDWRIAAVIAPVALAVIAYFVWRRTREQGA